MKKNCSKIVVKHPKIVVKRPKIVVKHGAEKCEHLRDKLPKISEPLHIFEAVFRAKNHVIAFVKTIYELLQNFLDVTTFTTKFGLDVC